MNIVNDNSNLTFQAKIVTKLKGRNNSMKELKTAFERISKNVEGELGLERNIWCNSRIFASANNTDIYVGDELHKFLSLENPTRADVNNTAKKALNTLKILQAEGTYNKKAEEINSTIGANIRRCENSKKLALIHHNNSLAEILQKNIDGLTAKRDSKIKRIQEQFFKVIDKYSNNSLDPNYGEYIREYIK